MDAHARAAGVVCAAIVATVSGAVACGAADTSSGFAGSPGGNENGPTADAGSIGDGPSPIDSGPPEKKDEGSYQSPVATGQYVWIANPTSGRVAYVRATTLDVRTVEAGNGPTYLAAVPDPNDDVAIVLNVLSHDATLLRAAGGDLSSRTLPVAEEANAWSISGNGRWAVAWGDASKVPSPDPTQGFQDMSVLDLSGAEAPITLAVGYRPVKVAFSSDGTRAFAVTQDGISVVDLVQAGVPRVVANFAISDDPTEDPGTRDVSITPDGSYALVRRDGEPDITVVALAGGARTTVHLPANATDLTLSYEGDRAIAVMRDIATIAILPLPAIAQDPTAFTTVAIPGEVVGRALFAKGGATAVLFTTVGSSEHLVVVSFAPAPSYRVAVLHAHVSALFLTDDGASAVALHDFVPDAGTAARGAFSLVPLAASLPARIQGTVAPPVSVALSPKSDRAIVAVKDDASATYAAYVGKLPSLAVDEYALASPPLATGVVAGANRAYVAQKHPDGRITFIDLDTGDARTLTGFELGARVVEGSHP